MLKTDQQIRIQRILRGERNIGDLDRLFADVRFAKPGFETVREIGHLAAHRGSRNRGIVLARVHDMQISARHWVRQQLGIRPSLEVIAEVGEANLRIMTKSRIRQLYGLLPQSAALHFRTALGQLREGQPLSAKDTKLVNGLGFSMTWQTAFSDAELIDHFSASLVQAEALAPNCRGEFARSCFPFVPLYALSLMHGANLRLAGGEIVGLSIGVREGTKTLRIRASIPVDNVSKPVSTLVSVFETSLPASRHCDPAALAPDAGPIELGSDGRLVLLT